MTLAAPWALGLLALVPVVVLFHLRRRRAVDVGSLLVWKQLGVGPSRSATRWSVPSSLVSLLLQLLAIVLLALALARPALGGTAAPAHLVVVIDASLPMQASDVTPTRFERARDAALDLVAASGASTRVSVISVAGDVRVVAAGVDPRDAATRLGTLRATYTQADWHAAARAIERLPESPSGTLTAVWTSPHDVADAHETLTRGGSVDDVAFHVVGSADGFVNAALRDVRLVPRGSVAGRWTIEGTIASVGLPPEVALRVQALFEPAGTVGPLTWGTTEITLDRTGAATFSVPVDLPGPGVLEVRLPGGDHLSSDDRVVLVAEDRPEVAVLVVGPENASLDRGLLAIPDVAVYRADTLPHDAELYDLVILDGAEVEAAPSTSTLWIGTDPPWLASEALDAAPDAVWRPDAWPADHPLTRHVDWTSLEVPSSALHPVAVDVSSSPLVSASGRPLIATRSDANGRQVVVAFDIGATSWPASVGFPVFLASVVDWATPDRHLGSNFECRVGRPCALPASAFEPNWDIVDEAGVVVARPTGWRAGPMQDLALWPEGLFDVQFVAERPGRFELRSPGATAIVPVAPTVVVDAGSDAAAVSEITASRGPVLDAAGSSTSDAWRWLAAAATIVIIVEGLRAGLGSERWLAIRRWRRGEARSRYIGIIVVTALAIGAAVVAIAHVPTPDVRPTHADLVVGPDIGSAHELVARLDAELAAVGTGTIANVVLRAPTDLPWPPSAYGPSVRRFLDQGASLTVAATAVDAALANPVTIETVSTPRRLRGGDGFELLLVVRNDTTAPVDVRVRLGGDEWIDAGPAAPGRTSLRVAVTAPDAIGPVSLVVDGGGESALLEQILWIEPPVRVLVVTMQAADAVAALVEPMRLQGLEVDVELPRRMPSSLDRLSRYDVVVLADVHAVAMHTFYQELLEEWVRERAGAVVILGGESSFGAGGYLLTPIDTLSPLSSRVPDEAPEVAIIFVLDKSGSMSARVGDATRLVVAQEATVAALDLLNPESLVGLVAFDAGAEVIAPMTPARDRQPLVDAVGRLQAGGGTDIYSGLVEARALLETIDAGAMHVVVMTDGITQPGDFPGVLGDLRTMGATTSFIGIGDGADQGQLRTLADLGGGNLHVTRDFRALPGIMAQETTAAGVDAVERQRVSPSWSSVRPSFAEGLPRELPPLDGYVRTTLKPAANLHLSDVGLDAPLMASWRYGAGRVLAFASDPTGAWGRAWLGAEDLQGIWTQIARWSASDVIGSGATMRAWYEGTTFHVVANVLDEDANPIPELRPTVAIVDPATDLALAHVRLNDGGAGTYHAAIPIRSEWIGHTIAFEGGPSAPHYVHPVSTVIPPPSPALDRTVPGGPTLANVVEEVDGRVVAGDAWQDALGIGRHVVTFDGPPIRWLWPSALVFFVALIVRYVGLPRLPRWSPRWQRRGQRADAETRSERRDERLSTS